MASTKNDAFAVVAVVASLKHFDLCLSEAEVITQTDQASINTYLTANNPPVKSSDGKL